jgi:hypothetical protein
MERDMRGIAWVAILLAWLVFAVETASAQSAIAGKVLDNTGGVLPGATVEASSPALIEGTRTAVTDGQGQYNVVNLRPGIYTVTFTMAGFGTIVREGVELPGNFTATIDVTMNVGSIAETITVSGGAPLVDVQQTQTTQILPRSVLDSIVTARNTWTQASLVAGVTMSGTDVGGTRTTSDLVLEAHGANASHTVMAVDGIIINTLRGDGEQQMYYQDQSNEEMAIQTSGGVAENFAGGVRLNLIPKEGGNRFAGGLYLAGSNGSWQSDNFTGRLRDQGMTSVDKAAKVWDYGATLGGPILKDRLWFHESVRHWGNHNPVANVIRDDGTQHITKGRVISEVTRLTWRVSQRDKIAAYFDHQNKESGPVLQATYPAKPSPAGTDPETGATAQNGDYPYWVFNSKWTSTLTNRFMLEAGFGQVGTYLNTNPMDGVVVTPFTPLWYERVRKNDLDFGTVWNAAPQRYDEARRQTVVGTASYVTGTHQIKAGTQVQFGDLNETINQNGAIQQQYRSGVPDVVLVYNYPVASHNLLKYDIGFFGQDSWTMNRLTLNYGLRVDMMNAYVPEQTLERGRFVPERNFAAVEDAPGWGPAWSPRFGATYDVFGNARTALKFSLGKYLTPRTTGLAQRLNPVSLASASIPWNDRDLAGRALATNGDDIAQDNELDLTRLPANFGERRLDRIDPDLNREYNVELAAAVQHALTDRISATFGWYRRTFHNQFVVDNQFRDSSDYDPVQVVSPYNGEVFTVYNLRNVSELSQVDNVITNASPDRKWIYNGFEFSMHARLPRGGNLIVGSITQRKRTNNCDAPDDPNLRRFCDRFNLPDQYNGVPFRSDLKVAGSYPIVWGIQVSGKFTSMPGRLPGDLTPIDDVLPITWNIARTTRYTAEQCAGRPCTAGALVVPNMTESSISVPLAPAGTELFMERQNQLDFGVRKNIKVRNMDWSLQFDLFNALNADTIIGYRSVSLTTGQSVATGNDTLVNTFGTATYMRPSAVVQGRIPRIGLQMKW